MTRFIASKTPKAATATAALSGLKGVQPEVIAKARKMAPPVGLLAGLFGSLVGVGGGVVIVPTIVSACKNIPQR